MKNYSKENFTIAYAPTRRDVFSRKDALKYKGLIMDKIKSFGYRIVDLENINEDGLLIAGEDIEKAVKRFKDKKADCLFIPHCNFGTEDVVARLAKEMDIPVLLWGPRDEAPLPDGTRLRDTQCGLFATSKILQRYDVPFTYIINSRVDDAVFARGFDNFTAASNAVKALKNLKVGQIGVRPPSFWTVIANEGELLEKFGIRVTPYNLSEVVGLADEIRKSNKGDYVEILSYIKDNTDIDIDNEPLEKIAALVEAVKYIKDRDSIDAFAMQCWTTLQDIYGIVPCFANGLLFDMGIPVACETDINGAITAVIANAATFGKTPFFADLTIRHPEDDNAELLWHCGNFPQSLAKEKSRLSCHFIFEGHPPGTANFEIGGDDLTILRFDGAKGNYRLFCGQAQATTGSKTLGTYQWIKVGNWPEWEERLIYGPYIHHVVGVHEKISPVLYEMTKYIKGLTLDAVDPDIKTIRSYLMGKTDTI